MDLSDFTKTTVVLPDKVNYYDEQDKQDKLANEVEITWKHNQLPVSELKFYIRENHEVFTNMVDDREQEILEIWMKELKYDPMYYSVIDKKIVTKGQIDSQEQIDEWLKPNPEGKLKVTKPEVI